jgi:hypothetical protein
MILKGQIPEIVGKMFGLLLDSILAILLGSMLGIMDGSAIEIRLCT